MDDTLKNLKAIVAAMVSKCNNSSTLIECIEILFNGGFIIPQKINKSTKKIGDELKNEVIKLRGEGYSYNDIAVRLEISVYHVQKILGKIKKR